MLTRRMVLGSSLALPAVSLTLDLVAPRAAESAFRFLQLERFVFDARFADAADLARNVAAGGVALAPMSGDLSDMWYRELDLPWRRAPQALAGMTTHEGLFVLQTLAMDRGMRVVYRGEHAAASDGRMAHRLEGPPEMLAPFASLAHDADWRARVARSLAACPLGAAEAAAVEFVSPDNGIALRDIPLYSWIIAPRHAVAVTIDS